MNSSKTVCGHDPISIMIEGKAECVGCIADKFSDMKARLKEICRAIDYTPFDQPALGVQYVHTVANLRNKKWKNNLP